MGRRCEKHEVATKEGCKESGTIGSSGSIETLG